MSLNEAQWSSIRHSNMVNFWSVSSSLVTDDGPSSVRNNLEEGNFFMQNPQNLFGISPEKWWTSAKQKLLLSSNSTRGSKLRTRRDSFVGLDPRVRILRVPNFPLEAFKELPKLSRIESFMVNCTWRVAHTGSPMPVYRSEKFFYTMFELSRASVPAGQVEKVCGFSKL